MLIHFTLMKLFSMISLYDAINLKPKAEYGEFAMRICLVNTETGLTRDAAGVSPSIYIYNYCTFKTTGYLSNLPNFKLKLKILIVFKLHQEFGISGLGRFFFGQPQTHKKKYQGVKVNVFRW